MPTNVKALYIDSNGVYRSAGSDEILDVANLKLTTQTTNNGVLKTDSSGNVTSALLQNANVASDAAIVDTKLATISTAGKVSNSATTAASANTASAIVARDGSGDFSANMITADLTGDVTGTADYANQWSSIRTVSFSGADVSGSFSIDGSANVSSVALTIDAGVVENSMLAGSITYDKLAGSIPDSKLDTISTAGKVADSALSSNVAKLNGGQTFTQPISVPNDPAQDAYAANKKYVDQQVANAVAGIDYKEECQWYMDVSTRGFSIADIEEIFNTGFTPSSGAEIGPFPGEIQNGDRILINNGLTDGGIYVFSGSDPTLPSTPGTWELTRASDMPAGSDAAGAYSFCVKAIVIDDATGNATFPQINTSYLCNSPKGTDVGSAALDWIVYGSAGNYTVSSPLAMANNDISLQFGGGLWNNNGTLSVKPDDSTIEVKNIGGSTYAVALKSLPSEFKINGDAVSASVTSDNLDTLVAGASSDAGSLHRHEAVVANFANTNSLVQGAGVYFNGTTLVAAAKTANKFNGVIASTSGGTTLVALSGEVAIWTPAGSVSAGDNVYVGVGGGFCDYASVQPGDFIIKVGKYLGNDRIAIAVQEFGVKP